MTMTTDEIIVNIDRSLAEIGRECERLIAARAELTGSVQPTGTERRSRRGRPAGRSRHTSMRVLGALDASEARTATDLSKTTGIDAKAVSTTLSRLVKSGEATKARGRGYLRVASQT